MYVVCVRDCDLRQLGPAAYICRYRYVVIYACPATRTGSGRCGRQPLTHNPTSPKRCTLARKEKKRKERKKKDLATSN